MKSIGRKRTIFDNNSRMDETYNEMLKGKNIKCNLRFHVRSSQGEKVDQNMFFNSVSQEIHFGECREFKNL